MDMAKIQDHNRDNIPAIMPSSGRVISIDVLRGFALVCMVLVHFTYHYGNGEAAGTFIYFFFSDVLADWGAAAFLMMMGISQALSANRMKDLDNRLLFRRALLRGGYLILTGLVMLLLAFGPGRMWRWDILTIMGFSTIVLFFCRFLPSWLLAVLSVGIAVLTPFARRAFNIASEWGGGFMPTPFISEFLPGLRIDPINDYSSVWHLGRIIKGFFLSGYFPVLPWVIFPAIGLIIGRRIVVGRLRRHLPVLLLSGFLALCMGFALAFMGRSKPDISVVNDLVSPLCFYPDSFSMINIQFGVSVIVFGMMFYCYDIIKKDKKRLGPGARLFTRTSNFSLTFYFLHYMLLNWPLLIICLFTGRYFYNDLTGAPTALLCGAVAVALLEVLIYYWEKAGSKYSLEWTLAGLTARIAPGYKRAVKNTT